MIHTWIKTMQDRMARPMRATGELSQGIMTVADDLYVESEKTEYIRAKP